MVLTLGYQVSYGQLIPITKNQKLRKEFKQDRKILIEDGWDIVPFPGESPQNIRSLTDAHELATNWGHDLLLPEALRVRIVAECKNNVVVKIFDTSGKSSHTYLQQGQLTGAVYTGETSGEDGNGHGTHVAGIIGGNDGLGILDVLIDANVVTWKPVKVLSNSGSGAFSWIASAIKTEGQNNKTLIDNGTFVVCTASLGGGTAKVTDVESALKIDADNGIIWTVAAGNSSGGPVNYPGNSDYVLAVGSLDNKNPLVHSSFESVGPELWLGMPGASIYSTYLNNSFATLSGTSMATPFQASACAIALSKWGKPLADKNAMKTYLSKIAADLESTGKDNYTGWGISYIKAILDTDPNGSTPPPPPPPPVDTTPPAHPVRNIRFSLTGPYKMYWNNVSGLSNETTFTAKSKRAAKAASSDVLTVTNIEVLVVNSGNMAPVEYSTLLVNTAAYFKNRAVVVGGNPDYGDATALTSYFYELILALQMPTVQYIDVERIEAKDRNGKTVVLKYDDLKHWKNTK